MGEAARCSVVPLPCGGESKGQLEALRARFVGDEAKVIGIDDEARVLGLDGENARCCARERDRVPGPIEVLDLHLGGDRGGLGVELIQRGEQCRRNRQWRLDRRRWWLLRQRGRDEAFEFAVGDAHLALIECGAGDGLG